MKVEEYDSSEPLSVTWVCEKFLIHLQLQGIRVMLPNPLSGLICIIA
jgi:hypothetical protein